MNGNAFFGGKSATPAYLWRLAREMRANPTPTEQRLWSRLRGRRLDGYRFRRQHILGRYIVDFFTFTSQGKGLVIELDGRSHAKTREYDAIRNDWMAAQGHCVLRFRNENIQFDLDAVLDEIKSQLHP